VSVAVESDRFERLYPSGWMAADFFHSSPWYFMDAGDHDFFMNACDDPHIQITEISSMPSMPLKLSVIQCIVVP